MNDGEGTTVSWQSTPAPSSGSSSSATFEGETVVRRVVDGRVEDAIEADQAARFVQFMFRWSRRNFDHAVEFLRQFVAESVPGMNRGRCPLTLRSMVASGRVNGQRFHSIEVAFES